MPRSSESTQTKTCTTCSPTCKRSADGRARLSGPPNCRGAFQTGQSQQIKATPILVNGLVYITTPDNLWALDARSARQVWHYTYPANEGFHIGHRGAAVHKDSVYLTTPDAHLVSLDARNGR